MNNNWWNNRVFYQIYPRSFYDTNGDGIGDINGIISKLDYLKDLGIGAIWLSPLYVSPDYDNGYDIADYYDVDPRYGSLDDMKRLLARAKELDIKIVMDLVVNHTSFKHNFFLQSKDVNSPYHDFYIWKKGKIDKNGKLKPPNNWKSMFMGPAWTYEPSNDMYYLHLFTPQQPDLNYDNPLVVQEVKKILKYWLDLGVAGFRCDVINVIGKNSFEDGKKSVYKTGKEHFLSTQKGHNVLKELHKDVLGPYNAYTVGETMDVDLENAKTFTAGDELTQVFPFDHTSVDYGFMKLAVFKARYKPSKMVRAMRKWQENVNWNPLFIENHDIPRAISRFGDEDNPILSGSAIAAMLLTLRGTPYIYQGQEIGMLNNKFKNLEEINDVSTRNVYKLLRKLMFPKFVAWKCINSFNRDHARTPMQWNASNSSGFTSGIPWLVVNKNYQYINVESSKKDYRSLFYHYKALIYLRSHNDALRLGTIEFLEENKNMFVFIRRYNEQVVKVIINMDKNAHNVKTQLNGTLLYTNYDQIGLKENKIRPYEVRVIRIEA